MNSDQTVLRASYDGDKKTLFNLAFKTGLLTVLTLGIYRFWQKTRIRKHVWSSVSAGGDTFEYTGTGLEKFLGFLVAILFLAVYVGLVQIVLFYLGLSVLRDPTDMSPEAVMAQTGAIYITLFAVLPFFLYAAYRARRYKMARTRFRGIRCGMEKGAWGYVLRALGYGLLSTITLGILIPLSTFKLEKYMADRSYYGSTRFTQNGKWTALYSAMKHIFISLGLLAAGGVLVAFGVARGSEALPVFGGIAMFVAYIWFLIGTVYYQVKSFAYLTSHKQLGDAVTFRANPSAAEVVKIFITGSIMVGMVVGLAFAVLAGIVAVMAEGFAQGGSIALLPAVVLGIGYLLVLVLTQALSLIWITQPIIALYIDTLEVGNAQALNDITQREAETGIDAEGFADALDIGGAI